jgi:electron transport complex protein RnfG
MDQAESFWDKGGSEIMKQTSEIKDMFKSAGILFAITLVAGFFLGFTYDLTKEPIRLQQEKAIQEACQTVFAQAESFTPETFTPSSELEASMKKNMATVGTVYEAKDAGGQVLGHVLEMTAKGGYGGDIVLYMGVTGDGLLNGISLLTITETPGLGMRAEEVLVPQFANRNEEVFTADTIDAISGATITTEAITNAVNEGLAAARELAGH